MAASPHQLLPLIGTSAQHLTVEERNRKWEFLNAAINQFPTDDVRSLSFEELYRTAYELVLRGEGEFLYLQVQKRLGRTCSAMAETLSQIEDDYEFCIAYKAEYVKYQKMVAHMGDILLYMERRYCQHMQKPTVRLLAGIELRLKVFEQSDVGKRVTQLVANYTNKLRELSDLNTIPQSIPLDAIHALIGSTLEFDSPTTKFAFHRVFIGDPLVQHSEAWFKDDVENTLSRLKGISFLNYVALRVDHEPKILDLIGLQEKLIRQRLQKLIQKVYVESVTDELFSTEEISLSTLFPKQDISTAALLYVTVKQCPTALNKLTECFTDVLTAEGLTILKSEKGKQAIAGLYKLREHANVFIKQAFEDDVLTKRCVRKALERMSTYRQLLSRNLATAVHEYLSELENAASDQTSHEEAVQAVTDRMESEILEPFRALRDKDAFEFHYRNDLINRFLMLLARRFVDDVESADIWGRDAIDLEAEALRHFVAECGAAYTQRIHGFFDDIKVSQDFQSKLINSASTSPVHFPADHMQVIVLSSNNWVKELRTIGKVSLGNVPEMSTWVRAYEDRYKAAFANRRLLWHTEFGRATVRFTPKLGTHVDIICSTAQAMFLLLFNQNDKLKWKDIKRILNIDVDPNSCYVRHFMGLVVHKEARFLVNTDGSRPKLVVDEDEFGINYDFTTTKRRLAARVVSIRTKGLGPTEGTLRDTVSSEEIISQQQDTPDNPDTGIIIGSSGLPLSVEQNRNTVIDAAIVRIMKARRKLTHLELITSLNDVLKNQFLPPGPLVKERVAYLIDREFLQRDANHHETYHYVA